MREPVLVVTGTRKGPAELDEVLAFAAEAGGVYRERNDRSLKAVLEAEEANLIAVWEPEGPVLYDENGQTFFFHPSMGKNRISRMRRGITDPLVDATGLTEGSSLLDCTLGLGADALVAGFLTGAAGKVIGLEASPVIAAIVHWGMKKYAKGPEWLKEALDQVEVVNVNHLEYLKGLNDNSFDVVYFDPMFREPVMESPAMLPLRSLANPLPVSHEALAEAERVAACRVVLKERFGSPEFLRLGIGKVIYGKNSQIAYGIIETGGQ